MITIYQNGDISMSGRSTGLAVTQRKDKTVVFTKESVFTKTPYREHIMPHQRYSLAHDAPASGAAGRDQFEVDVLELIKRL